MATNEELRELLGEIKAFRADVTETMRRFDERIAECEKALIKEKQKRKSKDEKIAADLKALYEAVNELAKTPIWEDKYDHRIAISRKAAYARFKELGVKPKDALDALARNGYLVRDSEGKNTRTVRHGREVERAVMINNGYIQISGNT